MTNIRLLPVVVLAIAALLVLKTLGLVTNGGYVLTGVSLARAAGGGGGHSAGSSAGTTESDATVTPAGEATIEDTSPTLDDAAPTLGEAAEADDGHGASAGGDGHGAGDAAEGDAAHDEAAAPASVTLGAHCVESDAFITAGGEVVMQGVATEAGGGGGAHAEPEEVHEGDAAAGHADKQAIVIAEDSFAAGMAVDCLPSGDAVPMEIADDGQIVPLAGADGVSATEQQLLERLTARRSDLQAYEDDLALRASIVDAAEKRIEERTATLEALEAQIAALVDQRQEMEAGQFAGIVAMYEAMKAKDAANIFNNLDMDVLLRVAKTMTPRKMAPILAEMSPARAQELTVQMAALADRPATEMTAEDLDALPQIVGQ
ncbi:MAG TPA: hypothetical protein VGN60_05910 [Devosia sp.]|nr:hypothetical protein [Devosia sp.]